MIGALTRTPPFVLPCEAFDESAILSDRTPGAILRPREKASLLFRDGHLGEPDYRRLKGEPQPESENVVVRLCVGDEIRFRVQIASAPTSVRFWLTGDGAWEMLANGEKLDSSREPDGTFTFSIHQVGKVVLTVRCLAGTIDADRLEFLS